MSETITRTEDNAIIPLTKPYVLHDLILEIGTVSRIDLVSQRNGILLVGDLFRVVVLDVEENLVVNKGELLYKGELLDIMTTGILILSSA
mgnify:CR=1 FL=1